MPGTSRTNKKVNSEWAMVNQYGFLKGIYVPAEHFIGNIK